MKFKSPHINPNKRYDIYDELSGNLIKSECRLLAILPAGLPLSDDEIKTYYNVDETSPHWIRLHRNCKNNRFVFDKCVVPCTSRYRFEVTSK